MHILSMHSVKYRGTTVLYGVLPFFGAPDCLSRELVGVLATEQY